jgi:hypothetical protein
MPLPLPDFSIDVFAVLITKMRKCGLIA